MKKIVLLILVSLIGMIGCKSTSEPFFVGDVLEISQSELSKYWLPKSTKVTMLSGRPDWLPKGAGKAFYFITIDSNGNEIGKELVNSIPDGWMTQKLLNKMPKNKYKPSDLNAKKVPVKVKVTSEVKRMS